MNILKYLLFAGLSMLTTLPVSGQIAGDHSFAFLNMSDNARVAALGGENITLGGRDVNMFYHNPALLNTEMNNTLGLNYNPYYAGINGGNIAYARKFHKAGTWGVNIRYVDYGTMEETLPAGQANGEFSANDYNIHITHSQTQGQFRMGASMQFSGSSIAGMGAQALSLNMGGIYTHPDSNLTIGLAIRNIGFALNSYTDQYQLTLPLNPILGVSFKPEHMPFRFSAAARHLNDPQPGQDYGTRNLSSLFARKKRTDTRSLFNKITGHLVLGGELLLSDHVHLRFGYNFLRRQQLKLQEKSGGAGLSAGAMVRINRFEFSFTRAYYHISGGTSYFTIATDLNNLAFKKVEK